MTGSIDMHLPECSNNMKADAEGTSVYPEANARQNNLLYANLLSLLPLIQFHSS